MNHDLNYPEDRINGCVWHCAYIKNKGYKYFITNVHVSCRVPKKARRLFYRACKKLHLNPKQIKDWYYFTKKPMLTTKMLNCVDGKLSFYGLPITLKEE